MDIVLSERAGVRYLHFSSEWIQGAMRIARPWALELDYTKEMMAGLLLRPDLKWPRQALLIGLGAGSLTKFLHRHRPAARLTVVEIEPQVVAAARQYFRLPDQSAHLRIVIGDGADFLATCRNSYDLIMIDGYDADARTGRLDTMPCYLDCKTRLSDDGLLVTNLLSRHRNCAASISRLQRAFADRAVAFPSCDSGNAVAFAATGNEIDLRLADMRTTARVLKAETGLNLLPTLARLEGWQHCPAGRIRL
jgi:spermidine synthase